MALLAKSEGGNFEKPSIGIARAVCVFVEDIGTHLKVFSGEQKSSHQIIIGFELEEKLKEGECAGKPFLMSKFYKFSLHEKSNLSKDLESWFSKKFTPEQRKDGFDIEKLIGINCQVNMVEIEKSDKSIDIAIGGIIPASKEGEKLVPVVTSAPEWVSKFRAKSLEAQSASKSQSNTGEPEEPFGDGNGDNDLPF